MDAVFKFKNIEHKKTREDNSKEHALTIQVNNVIFYIVSPTLYSRVL
jgi:hypothetical protein